MPVRDLSADSETHKLVEQINARLEEARLEVTMLGSLKQYTTSSAADKNLQPPRKRKKFPEEIQTIEKQEYFEDNEIKREPMDHVQSAELDKFD